MQHLPRVQFGDLEGVNLPLRPLQEKVCPLITPKPGLQLYFTATLGRNGSGNVWFLYHLLN